MEGNARPPRCLVTGATGYVGSRLVPELLAAGHPVRCMSRSISRLREFPWIDDVEAVAADAQDLRALRKALAGVDVAFYLIHSLPRGDDFAETDRRAARAFATAARMAGVRRIVYLGGLRPADGDLSAHLRSRSEVGEILLNSGVPTIVLRAAVILGAGSASFEMLRHLTERLPVMVAPRWVATRVQPIAIPDVLRYLVGCASLSTEVNRTFDIGGPDVLSYLDMMRRYAAAAGLPRRLVLRVPVLTPRLSSLWIGLVTPVPGRLARPLVDSLYHEVICRERDITEHLPAFPNLIGFDNGVRLALRWVRDAKVAASAAEEHRSACDPLPTDPGWTGGTLYEDVRERAVSASPKALWRRVSAVPAWFEGRRPASIGLRSRPGALGAVSAGLAGVVRRAGAVLGPWHVDDVEPGRLLRIRSGAPLPGIVWLELGVRSGTVPAVYTQRAMFHPYGLFGHLCWWATRPCARILLTGLESGVTAAASMERRPVTDQPRDITTLTGTRSPH